MIIFRKSILLFISIFLLSAGCFAQDTTQYIVPGRQNDPSQLDKPYVILISIDGFRYDFAKIHGAKNILQLSSEGVSAESMKPGFPSLTFPNHYSIITGLYPAHHGIVGNRFYDPVKKSFYAINNKKAVTDGTWYGGEPLWVLAEKQKMLAASLYWVGSEAAVDEVRPTYFYNYSEAFSYDRRVQVLLDWLSLPPEMRPHLITFYFPEVDHAAHTYGVYSQQTTDAVKMVDATIGKLNEMVKKTNLPINFVLLSDHGFNNVDTANTIPFPKVIDTSKFIIAKESTLIHLYAKDKSAIKSTYYDLLNMQKGFETFLKTDMPEKWHYGAKDDRFNRVGDIVMATELGKIFYYAGRKNAANHGFDNSWQEMQASFYAWGPAFKKNLKIKSFENVNVYPLIAHILGLSYDFKIDGDLNVLKGILK